MNPKHRMARERALGSLAKALDDQETADMRKSAGSMGLGSPLEKSGMEGEVMQKQSFSGGGEVKGKEPEYKPDDSKAAGDEIGSGDHDETSGSDFGAAWEELTGKKFKRPTDSEGLGGDSADDGSGEEAPDTDDEMSDEDKAKLSAAYHRHVLGKR